MGKPKCLLESESYLLNSISIGIRTCPSRCSIHHLASASSNGSDSGLPALYTVELRERLTLFLSNQNSPCLGPSIRAVH